MEVWSLYLHANQHQYWHNVHHPALAPRMCHFALPNSSASLLPSLTWPRWVFASCRRSSIESHQEPWGVCLSLSWAALFAHLRHLQSQSPQFSHLRHLLYKRPPWLIVGQQLVPARFRLQKLLPNLGDPHDEVDMAVGDGTRSLPRSSNAVKERKIASTWRPPSSSRTSGGAAPWSINRLAHLMHCYQTNLLREPISRKNRQHAKNGQNFLDYHA